MVKRIPTAEFPANVTENSIMVSRLVRFQPIVLDREWTENHQTQQY